MTSVQSPPLLAFSATRDLSTVPNENGPSMVLQPPVTSAPPAGAAVPTALTLTPEQSREALTARLTELVNAAPVILFMKGAPKAPVCRFSRRIVGILRQRKIEYDSFNILTDEDVRQGLKEFGNWPTFPQLWVDGKLVGGLDIVRNEFDTNPNFLSQYSVSDITG